jgi:hypothetical protein
MLPFLQPKKLSSTIIANRKNAATPIESSKPEGEHSPQLMAAAEALISAVHAKDATKVATALLDAFATIDQDAPVDEKSE